MARKRVQRRIFALTNADEGLFTVGSAAGRDQLVEASRCELVAWVSHDLRLPIVGDDAVTASWAYISVRDAGGGIAGSDLDRIFDAGFQAGDKQSGSGLGLAIAKGLIEAHRGELTVCNETDGALFTLRLPHSAAA